MAVPTIKLNNGKEIPAIGLGTWQSKPEEVVTAVAYALKEGGYRHIDCAWYATYLPFSMFTMLTIVTGATEMKRTSVKVFVCPVFLARRSLCVPAWIPQSTPILITFQITSKLWCTWHSRVEEALDQTLTNLGTDYLDRKTLLVSNVS